MLPTFLFTKKSCTILSQSVIRLGTNVKQYNHIFFIIIVIVGPDWALPLAIAANLHVPYRIKLGVDNLDAVKVKDHNRKG